MKSGRPKEYKNRDMLTTTFEHDLLERFKKICARDGKNMNEILEEQMLKWLKVHENGNEQYTLDDVVKAYPAFGRDYAIIESYFLSLKNEEFDEHKFKLQEWNGAFKKRFGVFP